MLFNPGLTACFCLTEGFFRDIHGETFLKRRRNRMIKTSKAFFPASGMSGSGSGSCGFSAREDADMESGSHAPLT